MLSCFSPVQLFVTLWTVACQSVLSNPSSVHGILQAGILEWVAMASFMGSSQPRNETCVSYISLLHWQVGSFTTSATWKPSPQIA